MKLGEHMRQMIWNKHATVYENSTIGRAITVINVKNRHISGKLPGFAYIIDLGGYSHVNTMSFHLCA